MANIRVKKLHDLAKIPKKQSEYAVGFDFHSIEDVIIDRNCTALIRTGIAVELEKNHELQIRPRSGLALERQLTILNSPGTIDPDYRGEVGIIMHNAGNKAQQVKIGDRIAQGVVNKVEEVNIHEVDELGETERGEGGFGSTGT